MYKTTKALVLREARYKEADKILTLLTESEGKITVKARGVMRKGSKIAAAMQPLAYSEVTLFGNRGRWSVNEASLLEPFSGLSGDLAKFSLGCYFAECAENMAVEDQPDAVLLQLILNSLYALSRDLYDPSHIKAVFELRLMALSGYEPNADHCAVCGKAEPDHPLLGLDSGSLCCRDCREKLPGKLVTLCPDSLAALRYVLGAGPKQIFSFRIGEEALRRLSEAAEQYLLLHTERRFSTLEYWKRVR